MRWTTWCRRPGWIALRPTPAAQQKVEDMALACRVKAALAQEDCVDLAVTCEFGNVLVYSKQGDRRTHRLKEKLGSIVADMPQINHVEVHNDHPVPPEAC